MNDQSTQVLVTGFPTTFLAARLVHHILQEQDVNITCIVPRKFLDKAKQIADEMGPENAARLTLLEGDVTAMDLGLSGKEYVSLTQTIQIVHHCAAATYLGVGKKVAYDLNVRGTLEILEFAQEAERLERLVHWSTALVSGARKGYVLEEELEAPAGFRNPIEETRFQAEQLVRSVASNLPVTILRPSVIVGDSISGEIDRFEGPYLLVLLMLNSPVDMRMPLPGRGDIPLNLVPIDYVVEAGLAIARDRRSLGKTFHLVDPSPKTARVVFEQIARHAKRPSPRGFLPTNLATALLRTPGLERFAHAPRAFLEQLATEVVYDNRNTREILNELPIQFPDFDSYVAVMVEYVRAQQEERRSRSRATTRATRDDASDDPLE